MPTRTGIPKALAYALPLLEQLRQLKDVLRAEIAGKKASNSASVGKRA